MPRKPGRPYIHHLCKFCGNQATLAFQVLSRTVGIGQGRHTRKIKLSTTVHICESCSRSRSVFSEPLIDAAKESLSFVRSRYQHVGPGLFDQAEA
jgi:hypothetical protein